jgi:hypothetical protein
MSQKHHYVFFINIKISRPRAAVFFLSSTLTNKEYTIIYKYSTETSSSRIIKTVPQQLPLWLPSLHVFSVVPPAVGMTNKISSEREILIHINICQVYQKQVYAFKQSTSPSLTIYSKLNCFNINRRSCATFAARTDV